MADAELSAKISTTSDIPEAMDKAKKATQEFAKQAEKVNKRFKDSFVDILLSTAGPMAALGVITQRVTEYFDRLKQAQDDANSSAIDGINEKMAKEDIYYARKVARDNEEKKNKANAARQPQTTAYEFLMSDPRGISVAPLMAGASDQRMGPTDKTTRELLAERYSKDPKIQEMVRQLVAEDLAKYGMIDKPGNTGQKAGSFQGPQGVNAVVGMGNNAAMQAQLDQLEESRKQTSLLQNLVERNPFLSTDFTKPADTSVNAPSRSAYLNK